MKPTTEVTFREIETPVGGVRVVCRGPRLVAIHIGDQLAAPGPRDATHDPALAGPVIDQLEEYFAGERRAFDLEFDLEGTPFQQIVWRTLATIPFGESISYGELARRVGRPSAVRAVGGANARNPISIVVPCHRVVGADGRLTGYAGGLPIKRFLLDHERRVLGGGAAEAQGDLLTFGGLSA